MKAIKTLAVLVVVAALAGIGFVYSGLYDIGADSQRGRQLRRDVRRLPPQARSG